MFPAMANPAEGWAHHCHLPCPHHHFCHKEWQFVEADLQKSRRWESYRLADNVKGSQTNKSKSADEAQARYLGGIFQSLVSAFHPPVGL